MKGISIFVSPSIESGISWVVGRRVVQTYHVDSLLSSDQGWWRLFCWCLKVLAAISFIQLYRIERYTVDHGGTSPRYWPSNRSTTAPGFSNCWWLFLSYLHTIAHRFSPGHGSRRFLPERITGIIGFSTAASTTDSARLYRRAVLHRPWFLPLVIPKSDRFR